MAYETVGEVVEAINTKTDTRDNIASQLSINPKTIQMRLKKLGFVWDATIRKYVYDGSKDLKEVYAILFESLGQSGRKYGRENYKVKAEAVEAVEPVEDIKKPTQPIKPSKAQPKPKTVKADHAQHEQLDMIDMLMQNKKQEAKREYRGFYFDKDVLAVIDSLASGKKSELINQVLRKVFTEKGYL